MSKIIRASLPDGRPLVLAGAGEEQYPLQDTPCSRPLSQAPSCLPLPPPHSVQSHCCHCGWSRRCCRRCCHSPKKSQRAHLGRRYIPQVRMCAIPRNHVGGYQKPLEIKLWALDKTWKRCLYFLFAFLSTPWSILVVKRFWSTATVSRLTSTVCSLFTWMGYSVSFVRFHHVVYSIVERPTAADRNWKEKHRQIQMHHRIFLLSAGHQNSSCSLCIDKTW